MTNATNAAQLAETHRLYWLDRDVADSAADLTAAEADLEAAIVARDSAAAAHAIDEVAYHSNALREARRALSLAKWGSVR